MKLILKKQPYDIALEMKNLSYQEQLWFINYLPNEKSAEILSYLNRKTQYYILTNLCNDKAQQLLDKQPIDIIVNMMLTIDSQQIENVIDLFIKKREEKYSYSHKQKASQYLVSS
ncbi:magnesium transporter MgtE N-terminal domain-containing protein [Bacillus sp. C1]